MWRAGCVDEAHVRFGRRVEETGRPKGQAPRLGPTSPRQHSLGRAQALLVLLAFYDYPAEHWIHLRTTNPIESTFSTVRHQTKVTKGPGSRAAGLTMAFKLIESAQARWRAVNAPQLVALVRAGAMFINGKHVERPVDQTSPTAA